MADLYNPPPSDTGTPDNWPKMVPTTQSNPDPNIQPGYKGERGTSALPADHGTWMATPDDGVGDATSGAVPMTKVDLRGDLRDEEATRGGVNYSTPPNKQ